MDTQNDFLDNAVNDELDIGQEVDMQSQMCSYLHDDMDENCSLLQSDTCGDGGWTTTQKYVEILEFTHFTEFWTFNEVGVNHKEKVQVRKVEVSVVLDLDT